MKNSENAISYFKNNFNCSQSVFAALGPELGVPVNQCLRIGCAFGAGIGKKQLTCGAVTGALMAIGLKYGKGLNDSNDKKTETYEKSNLFMNEFIKTFGTISCRELLSGLDMNDENDIKKINELKLFETRCANFVKFAADHAGEIIGK